MQWWLLAKEINQYMICIAYIKLQEHVLIFRTQKSPDKHVSAWKPLRNTDENDFPSSKKYSHLSKKLNKDTVLGVSQTLNYCF